MFLDPFTEEEVVGEVCQLHVRMLLSSIICGKKTLCSRKLDDAKMDQTWEPVTPPCAGSDGPYRQGHRLKRPFVDCFKNT